jgi:hypothetical protein
VRRYLAGLPVAATSGPFEARVTDEAFVIITHGDEPADREHWVALEEVPALLALLQAIRVEHSDRTTPGKERR